MELFQPKNNHKCKNSVIVYVFKTVLTEKGQKLT